MQLTTIPKFQYNVLSVLEVVITHLEEKEIVRADVARILKNKTQHNRRRKKILLKLHKKLQNTSINEQGKYHRC